MNTIDAMKRISAWLNDDAGTYDDGQAKWDRLRVARSDITSLIAREEAQTVEPVGEITGDGFSMLYGHKPLPPGTKLFTRPAPAVKQPMSTEREALIAKLLGSAAWLIDGVRGTQHLSALDMRAAADMLAADAPDLCKLIEGMSVSIDVSTGEYDSGNRLFGVVNEVMESSGDKNGMTLLVYETTSNFKPAQQVAVPQSCVHVTEAMHIAAVKVLQRASGLDGLPQRMLDAMLAAAPQQEQKDPS